MKKINEILKRNNINCIGYKKKGKCIITYNDDKCYVIKPNKNQIYNYLLYRNFNNIPNIKMDSGYEISEYIKEIDIPVEQKLCDLITVISLLHKKTTYYKKINEFNIKKLYDSIKEQIEESKNEYDILINSAENTIYMSPSQYFLVRHISFIYSMINYCDENLEKWYNNISKLDRVRVSVIHNNLSLEHFINDTLISWNNSKVGLPTFDLYKLYQSTYNLYDWNELLNIYTSNFLLKDIELDLFYILISIPLIPNITNIEIDNVKELVSKFQYLEETYKFVIEKKDEVKIENEI